MVAVAFFAVMAVAVIVGAVASVLAALE